VTKLRQLQRASTGQPLRVVAHGDHHRPVGRVEELIRHEIGMAIPPAPRFPAGDQYVLCDVHERRRRTVGKRYRNEPSLPAPEPAHERTQDRDRGILARDHVRERDPNLHRLATGLAGDRHPAAFCLDYKVITEPFALGAEAGDGAPHQLRPIGKRPRRIQAVTRQCPAAEVVHDHVGVEHQLGDHLPVSLRREVGGDAQLVAIDAEIVGAFPPCVEGRPPSPGVIPGARTLDLDDIGTQIAEHHGAERTSEHACQIEHTEAR